MRCAGGPDAPVGWEGELAEERWLPPPLEADYAGRSEFASSFGWVPGGGGGGVIRVGDGFDQGQAAVISQQAPYRRSSN
ncbi:unnamed protein product, partial [Iphiclides podalirius]